MITKRIQTLTAGFVLLNDYFEKTLSNTLIHATQDVFEIKNNKI